MKPINMGGVTVGGDAPCRVVAEISNNHNGVRLNAFRLVEECVKAGADFIKLQAYTPYELVALRGNGRAPEPWGSDGWSMFDLYKTAQTPPLWFAELAEFCADLDVPWFASIFGDQSFNLLVDLDFPPCAVKVAALDRRTVFAHGLVNAAGRAGMPVVASCREHDLIDTPDGFDLVRLYCPPGYPQDPSDFDGIRWDRVDGISYHGTNHALPMWAAGSGAHMVEVHVQLPDAKSKLEADVSMTTDQLAHICKAANG